jgi:hypothetical protein
MINQPIPVAARSKARVCGHSPAEIWVRIPPGAWMSIFCECCVLSGTGLCDELFTRPEESYWMWCVVVCYSRNPKNEETLAYWGLLRKKISKLEFPELNHCNAFFVPSAKTHASCVPIHVCESVSIFNLKCLLKYLYTTRYWSFLMFISPCIIVQFK